MPEARAPRARYYRIPGFATPYDAALGMHVSYRVSFTPDGRPIYPDWINGNQPDNGLLNIRASRASLVRFDDDDDERPQEQQRRVMTERCIKLVGTVPFNVLGSLNGTGRRTRLQAGSIVWGGYVALRVEHDGPPLASLADGSLEVASLAKGLLFNALVPCSVWSGAGLALNCESVAISPTLDLTDFDSAGDGDLAVVYRARLTDLSIVERGAIPGAHAVVSLED